MSSRILSCGILSCRITFHGITRYGITSYAVTSWRILSCVITFCVLWDDLLWERFQSKDRPQHYLRVALLADLQPCISYFSSRFFPLSWENSSCRPLTPIGHHCVPYTTRWLSGAPPMREEGIVRLDEDRHPGALGN